MKALVSLLVSIGILMLVTSQTSSGLAQGTEINLIGQEYKWEPFGAAKISQNDTGLKISAKTDFKDELWSRAFLTIQMNSATNRTLNLNLGYASNSVEGKISEYGSTASLEKAKFQAEFRDKNGNKTLWSSVLNNTRGQPVNQTFSVPSKILNQPIEFRLYIMTNGPGQHTLDVNKATIEIH